MLRSLAHGASRAPKVPPARARTRTASVSLLGVLALSSGACTGRIGELTTADPSVTDGGRSEGAPGTPSGRPVCEPGVRAAGDAPVRRLTRDEYDNTVRDLLGDTTAPARRFPPDSTLGIFASNTDAPVNPLLAQMYFETAERLATAAAPRLETLAPCDRASRGDGACALQFITDFGRRAYRRPLEADEIARMRRLYDSARAAGDPYAIAVQTVLQAFLQSPFFLHHIERGTPAANVAAGAPVPLTGYEIAARLSYLIFRTTPDETLLDAAAAGRLDTADGVASVAATMLRDPRARAGLRNFYAEWLALADVTAAEKDAGLFPEFDPSLAQAMRAETERFVDEVLWNGDGRLETLLTADFGFVNEALARVYGMAGVTGTELRRVRVEPLRRGGVLTQASFLAGNAHNQQTNPVGRGKFVRLRFLCGTIDSPPPGIDTTPPPLDPTRTTRERFAEHESNPYCGGCHRLMDPIGLGFEHFDAIGRYRSTEAGRPVDARGNVAAQGPSLPQDFAFEGATELAQWLAQSPAARECVATVWFRYGLGRQERDEDLCSLQSVRDRFGASHDLRELVDALVRTDAFRYRRAITATSDGECR